jgi:Endonuclease/Exonuclease/phosphatase family
MSNNTDIRGKVICWNLQRLFYSEPSKLALNIGATAQHGYEYQAYQAKIEALSMGLSSICPDQPPALLALCEVENEQCIRDLMDACGWRNKMAFVRDHKAKHLQGLDTVLLYRKDLFKLYRPRPSSHVVHNRFKTRNILEVSLYCKMTDEPLHVILNHWPSRLWTGADSLRVALGEYCSRVKRKVTAKLSIPSNKGEKGVRAYLKKKPKIYNPCWKLLSSEGDNPKGTVYWSSKWYLLDQVLFSAGLLALNKTGGRKKQLHYESDSLYIHTGKEKNNSDSRCQFVTKGGYPFAFDPKRKRGISDHLPLVFNLVF